MKPLVEATYILEGDGPCAIIAYSLLRELELWFQVHSQEVTYPGMAQAIDECLAVIGGGNLTLPQKAEKKAQIVGKVRDIITPAIQYFT